MIYGSLPSSVTGERKIDLLDLRNVELIVERPETCALPLCPGNPGPVQGTATLPRLERKGFPESYDLRALLQFLADIKAGRRPTDDLVRR